MAPTRKGALVLLLSASSHWFASAGHVDLVDLGGDRHLADSNDPSCRKEFKDVGTTFDLSHLTAKSRYYNVKHKYESRETYSYAFNICGNTNEIPGAGSTGLEDACVNTTESGAPNEAKVDMMRGPSPAFQVAHVDNECYRLGEDYANGNVEWSLLEEEDPARGVKYTYKGGNKCSTGSDSGSDIRRSLTIALVCADDVLNVPDEEVIDEVSTCTYEIQIESLWGCPAECGVKNYKLCNQMGICRYDRTAKASRCFCDEGWEGDDCGTETQPNKGAKADSATLGTLIFVSLLLTCVIAGIGVVWVKIRGLRLDPAAYATLSGGNRAAQEEL